MRVRRIAIWVSISIALLVIVALLVPWKPFAEKKLIAVLAGQGISPAQISIDHIGWRGLVLKDVVLGEPAIKLSTMTLGYRLRALLDRRVEDIEITGLSIHAVEDDAGWSLQGLQPMLQKKTEESSAAIPVTAAALSALPFRSISVRESRASLAGKAIKAEFPLRIMLQPDAAAKLEVDSQSATLQLGEHGVAIGRIKLELIMDEIEPQWNGTWMVEDITINSEMLHLPTLFAKGLVTVHADSLKLSGTIESKDNAVKADVSLDYFMDAPKKSYVLIKQAQMPLNGGTVATKAVKLPLDGKKHALSFIVTLSELPVEPLMQTLTSNRATASGLVSGEVPVTIAADGALRFGKSMLKANSPGVISLAPDVIPGDNPQVSLVREVMKNLQYRMLVLEFGMGADNMLAANLAVEGHNPDVEGGRPIKLNINLSGDLLDLIKQNVKLMTSPETFIEQKNDKTKP